MKAAVLALAALLLAPAAAADDAATATEWRFTEGAAGGGRYSPLADITPANVERLRVAWHYRHDDFHEGPFYMKVNKGTAAESTPIVADGRLIFTTPYNRVIALDPETGRELWSYDPEVDLDRTFANMIINRGVGYWSDPEASGPCARRVFLGTLDARLIALDATTGRPCADFANAGTRDLLADLPGVFDAWEYNLTSPPTVAGDVVVVGSSIADTVRRRSPPGDVRGFDARSGELLWTFHTIPHAGEFGHDTWLDGSATESGAANVWSTITWDPERDLLFLPVSTPSPDFYGGDRPGDNLFSDSVVALRARTGERVWHFQTVHHDLWDYDLAAPPVLVEVERAGRRIPAVAQATKHGFVFVLHRETGEPLFPVEERPVPASDVEGERASPTQPFPTAPPPLVPQRLDADDLYAPTPEHLEACRERLAELRNDGLFTPPSRGGSVLYPFTAGGANWSGAGFDPTRRVLYVPVNNLVHEIRLKGPLDDNVTRETVRPLRISISALWWLFTGRGTGLRNPISQLGGRQLMRHDGIPCNAPPWGMIAAVDLDAGTILWRVPTGEKDGVRGFSNFGPLLVSAGGLIFHGGTQLSELRIHAADDGRVLRVLELPAGLHAGPISYRPRPDAPQYLVIAPGGHVGKGSRLGGHVIAYTLDPEPAGP